MGQQIPNTFTAYDLTTKEVLLGSIYTELQLQVLQNYLSTAAEERLVLEFDVDNPTKFMQDDAYLKAKVEFLAYLIDTSKVSAAALTTDTTI